MYKIFTHSKSPDFIIIGAQKSGTSSLHNYLNQHPNLIGSRPKEIHYFDKWINYGFSIKWYEDHFCYLVHKNKLFFESSPNYIYHESAAKHISKFYPRIKLVLVLRNPLDRAFSAWNMYRSLFKNGKNFNQLGGKYPNQLNPIHEYLFKDRNEFPCFEEALSIELDLIKKGLSHEPSFLRRGIYVDQINTYYKYFNQDQILILGFKDLIENLDSTLCSIYEKLGVSKIPTGQLNISPRNEGIYGSKLNYKQREWLKEYYMDYNHNLFLLLRKKINW